MKESQILTASMVPALEATSDASWVGAINRVPALRVRLTIGQENLDTIGVIDTASEFSMIDDGLLKSLSTKPKTGVRVSLSTGLSRKQLWMYHLDVALLGDTEQDSIILPSVPVVVANLNRNFVIGRRGILDKLRLELDFPGNRIGLTFEQSSSQQYPSLSKTFPNFEATIQNFDSHNLAQATMLIAWDMETFVDRLIQENSIFRVPNKSKSAGKMTLGEKLRHISKQARVMDLRVDIQEFVEARNTAFHAASDKMNALSADIVLGAAERIVSELSKIASEERMGMTYHLFKDLSGEWRWRLKAANGRIIADSSDGYRSKQDCVDDINRIRGRSAASIIEE